MLLVAGIRNDGCGHCFLLAGKIVGKGSSGIAGALYDIIDDKSVQPPFYSKLEGRVSQGMGSGFFF
ncbi:hypothetical protein D3C81_2186270 [compost metagenome]